MSIQAALPTFSPVRLRELPPTERNARPRLVTAFGETRTISYWATLVDVGASVLRRRLDMLPPEVAILLPPHAHVDREAAPGAPCSWTWELLDWKDDSWARAFVAKHPAGASLEEVGDALGIVRERVRQVEEQAMQKVRAAVEELGLDFLEMLDALREDEIEDIV